MVIKKFQIAIAAFILCLFVSTFTFASPIYLDQSIEDNCGKESGLSIMSFKEIDEGYHYTLVPAKKKATKKKKKDKRKKKQKQHWEYDGIKKVENDAKVKKSV